MAEGRGARTISRSTSVVEKIVENLQQGEVKYIVQSSLLIRLRNSSLRIVEKIKNYSSRKSDSRKDVPRRQSILTISRTDHPDGSVKVKMMPECRRGSHQTVLERCLVAREARIRRRSSVVYGNL